jgi:Secretion system C-terminal sorting domain
VKSYIFHIILGLMLLVLPQQMFAQCAFGGNLLTGVNPTGAGFTSSHAILGGSYVTVAVCTGATYTFATCGNTTFDTQITVYNEATSAFVAYNDDGCGIQSTITWIATFTGTVRVMVNRYNCNTSAPGVTTTLVITQTTACGSAVAPPNDNCTGALAITCGQTIAGNTSDAGADAIVTGCGNNTSPSEWYVFTGTGQNITASLCGSAFDTQIGVVTGTCGGTFTCVAYNDDSCGNQSQVVFASTLGVTYYIRVSGFATASGAYSLALTCATPAANDPCSGALPIACGQTITGSTTDATPEAIVTGCGNATSASEWYVFTGNGQNIVVSLCGSAYDTYLSVVTGACGSAQTCVAFNDDSCGAQSQVSFTSTVGVLYYIRVAGFGSGSGNYTLALNCFNPVVNDACSGALPIACGQTITGTTAGAFPEANIAGCGNATAPTVWYSFVGTGQLTTASLCGSAYDTQLGVLTGTCPGALTCVAGSDDFCGTQSQVSFSSVVGQTYYFRIGGFGSTSGNFSLAVTCITETGNDPCSGAIPIACGSTTTGTTVGLNIDAIPAGCGLSNSAGAWYSFVGDGQMTTLSTCATNAFDTQISVFIGGCSTLSCVATNDQFCANQSEVTFLTTSGTTYYVLVHGADDSGAFILDMTCTPYVPSAQDCQGANTVCNDQQFNGNSSGFGVSQELNTSNGGCLFDENQSSWYVFSAVTTGTISFAINPTPMADYDFAIWGPFASVACPPTGAPTRCSYSAANVVTGLGNGATDLTEGAGGDAWVAPITIGAAELNQIYIMVLDNFSSTTTPFVFDWSLGGGLTLDCTIQLPVMYTEWDGLVKGDVNLLYWTTATESMNEMFVIEKSRDNIHFEYAGSVLGHGTSLQEHHYTWDDNKPWIGTTYYRLKQFDWNGAFEYSSVIALERQMYFSVAPNPADEVVHVTFNNDIDATTIELTDMCGRMIIRKQLTQTQQGQTISFDLSAVQPGTYSIVMRHVNGHALQHGRVVVR